MKIPKCQKCGKELQNEDKYKHGSKNYCGVCYKQVTREANEYKKLVEYICVVFSITRPNGFILKQIKDLKTNYNYSYLAIQYTMWYCKEILDIKFNDKYGISLIKNYYDEAKKYYCTQEQQKNKLKNIPDDKPKIKIIKQNFADFGKNKTSFLLNLNSLMKEGDSN